MSTITQEAPSATSNSSDGPKLPDYPSLPSDAEMKNSIINTRVEEIKKAVKADQLANPNEVSPFIVDAEQEQKLLPKPKDVEGSLVISGFDKYHLSK